MSVEDADLSLLSDAERAAIEEEEHEEVQETETEAETPTEQPDADQPAEETTEEAVGESDEEPAEEEEVVAEDRNSIFAPSFRAQGVENFQEAMGHLDAQFDEAVAKLADQYENGDLSFSEYRKQERQLSRDFDAARFSLHEANLKAEIAAEHSRQSLEQKWRMEQELFYSDNPDYKSDPILRGALSAQLDQMYRDEKLVGRSGLWFLREAAKAVDARFNRATPAKQDSAKLQEVKETLKKREVNRPELPKTLAEVPAAADNLESNEFAHLDKLSGLEYERALAAMKEDDRERYLSAA